MTEHCLNSVLVSTECCFSLRAEIVSSCFRMVLICSVSFLLLSQNCIFTKVTSYNCSQQSCLYFCILFTNNVTNLVDLQCTALTTKPLIQQNQWLGFLKFYSPGQVQHCLALEWLTQTTCTCLAIEYSRHLAFLFFFFFSSVY